MKGGGHVNRTTLAALTLSFAATERTLSPASTRTTVRSRKSIEYGRVITTNLLPGP